MDLIGIEDVCVLDIRQTVYASDISARISFEYPYDNSQGPYDLQVNGISFENQYLYSLEALCCNDIFASDFNYDFEVPGTYPINLESIAHTQNDCNAVIGSPIMSQIITVLPPPTFDLKYACLQNGDLQLDIILTSALLPYYDLFFVTFGGSASNTPLANPMPGDIIYSETSTLIPGNSYTISIWDCVSGGKFHESHYIHNCVTCLDSSPPTAICKNLSVDLTDETIQIDYSTIDNGSIDDCGIVSYGISENSFDCSDIGQNIVVLEIADGSGNISECTSLVTVTNLFGSCSTCYSLDRSPTIEFSHTELDGQYIKIWYRMIEFMDYVHLNPDLVAIDSENFVFYDSFDGTFRTRFSGSSFNRLDEFMYLRLSRDFQFQDCDRIETSLTFIDGLCDVSYMSNSLILDCDNDNDGFTVEVDCDDNDASNFPVQGQPCCPSIIVNIDNPIIPSNYEARTEIISSGTVSSGLIEFSAGNSVSLNSLFEVETGAVFHAFIDGCDRQ